ncbi:MAG: arginine--tRNA ligase [Planctomycetia bacterium]|nr:arginine--tRNA ligase [Planctomycetia bacterium]
MILQTLRERFHSALSSLVEDPDQYLDLIRSSQDPKFGDYQANFAMVLGKKLGCAPREIAARIVEKLDGEDLFEKQEIAGPGFINLRLRSDWLADQIQKSLMMDQPGNVPVANPKTFILDYSSPNVAKPLHVGHIRSTMIGNALYRILRYRGHHAIGDNHLGDWGTQFGMIIYGFRNYLDEDHWKKEPIQELGRLYKLVRKLSDENPEIAQAVLNETSKLHHGDPENLKLWKEFLPVCLKDIERIYSRLGVSFDLTLGESFYHDKLAGIVDELIAKGIARETEGAIGIFLEGQETPMLIRKKDGAFLYATTDIATLRYRQETYHPDAILYLVDSRQSLHFEQLFQVARMIGLENMDLVHIKFGTILGEDGRPFKTRSGETVGLEFLLDEAESRALKIVCENDDAKKEGPQLLETERKETARKIGIGALIYADLSQNRESDYVFNYDRMLAMNGNTATYMQYAYARIRSIFTKGGIDSGELDELLRRACDEKISLIKLNEPEERNLALELLKFSDALDSVIRDYRPNQLTSYLYDLANRYSSFFEKCPVLRAEDDEIKRSRLLLCELTARTIGKGLDLLGIQTVDRM